MSNNVMLSYNNPKAFGHFAKSQTNNFYDLKKGFTLPTGLNEGLSRYEVSPDVQLAYKIDTPLKNLLPRVNVTGGIAVGFKVIKEIDTKTPSYVRDGSRSRFVSHKIADEAFFFVTFGVEDFVTDNAQYASMNFSVSSQAINLAQKTLTETMAVQEEKKIIGGNREKIGEIASISLTADTKGSLEAGAVSVIVVPLSYSGFDRSSLSTGVALTADFTDANGWTTTIPGGHGVKKSATVTVEASGSVNVLIADVADAVGYAVFAGAAGSERLVYVGSRNNVTITALPSDTQLASALPNSDQSENKLDYEGLLSLAGKRGIVKSLDGASLVLDGVSIDVLEEAIASVTDKSIEPTHIVMDTKTYSAYFKAATKDAQFMQALSLAGVVNVGGKVGTYMSPNAENELQIIKDKYLPTGTMLLLTLGSAPNLQLGGNLVDIQVQEEYNLEIWARRTRATEMGIYCTSVLVHRYPETLAVIKNVGV